MDERYLDENGCPNDIISTQYWQQYNDPMYGGFWSQGCEQACILTTVLQNESLTADLIPSTVTKKGSPTKTECASTTLTAFVRAVAIHLRPMRMKELDSQATDTTTREWSGCAICLESALMRHLQGTAHAQKAVDAIYSAVIQHDRRSAGCTMSHGDEPGWVNISTGVQLQSHRTCT